MSQRGEITVGICAHNEEDTIGTLLDQVLNEDIPLAEIIVVTAGGDDTADIVAGRAARTDTVLLIREDERQGQTAAQNTILSHTTGEALLLLDGDGTIRPGSIEALYERYTGENLVSGAEVPVTDASRTGRLLDTYAAVHHRLCTLKPRFSTQMGIMPAHVVDRFPPVMLDDVYIEHRAAVEGLPIEYAPSAVKYHHIPNRMRPLLRQQKRNWAGRFQAERRGYEQSKSPWLMMRAFLEHLLESSPRELPSLVVLLLLELAGYIGGRYHQAMGTFPTTWWRPPSRR